MSHAAEDQAHSERVSIPAPPRLYRLLGLSKRPWWRDVLRRRLLALADGVAALLASASLVVAGGGVDSAFWATVFVPAWIVIAKLHGLYDRDHRALRHLTVDEIPRLLGWALVATATLIALLTLTPAAAPAFGEALRVWAVAAFSAIVLRALARAAWRRLTPPERVLIVGQGALAAATRRKLELFPDIHGRVVGQVEALVADDVRRRIADVDRVVLASPALDEALIARLVAACRAAHVKLSVVPPARGIFGTAVQLEHLADLPVIEYNTWDVSRSTLLMKRILDVALALPAFVLLLPVMLLIGLAIRADSRGPALFTQRRGGVGGAPFRIYKFRTMVADAEARLGDVVSFDSLPQPMFKLEHDPRVTRVGRVLRRTSLDELPQLANVLKGDMSLVGPRPEQLELIERYAPEHRFRVAVKPGMTGPMQVYGRGKLTFEERLAVEREYIENPSIGRDLRILARTVGVVLTGRGAS